MTHFEFTFLKQRHDHLICVDCGRIVEFTNTRFKNIPREISEELGFEYTNYSFNIFARCKNPENCKHYHEEN